MKTTSSARIETRLSAILLGTMAALVATSCQAAENAPFDSHSGRALLIGCTDYPNQTRIPKLFGPGNDVPMFARLLHDRFGFDHANIHQLVGWPDDAAQRPTRANIVAAFEDLIAHAAPGDRIVILMSGHGSQVPIPNTQQDPLAAENPEPDGMDEIFLPSDVGTWSEGGLEHAIRDNEIAAWLDALRNKGAHVWAVFDCCHSGTMRRGGARPNDENAPLPDEISRGVGPSLLGIPREVLDNAARKALAERGRGGAAGSVVESGSLEVDKGARTTGSVTAFYAAQSFEEAPELPRPSDAPRVRENYYGLLSYVLAQILKQQEREMTYRELSREVVTRYRAERGGRGPTPFVEGDLDREVLGLDVWPQRSRIILEKRDGKYRLNAGELLGLVPGTILAVSRSATAADVPAAGYVRVIESTATTARVEACEFEGIPEVPLDELPGTVPCRIVSQALGDMRVRLMLRTSDDPKLVSANETVKSAISRLPEEVAALVEFVQNDQQAAPDWSLHVVSPNNALEFYDIQIDEPKLFLVGRRPNRGQSQKSSSTSPANPIPQVFQQYSLENLDSLRQTLERDLRKVFTWQNVWRITASSGMLANESNELEFEIALLDEEGTETHPLESTHLRPGQRFVVRLRNESSEDYWVTILFLSADLRIEPWVSGSVRSWDQLTPSQGQITSESTGIEGFVLLAIPFREHKLRPDFDVLIQTGLGEENREIPKRGAKPQTPFNQLLWTAAHGGPATRGAARIRVDSAQPEIRAWSWITLP